MSDMQEHLERALTDARATLNDDPAAAIRAAEELSSLAQAHRLPRFQVEALRVQVQGCLLQGRHADSLEYALRATALARELGEELLAAQVQIAQVDILGWLNRAEEAFALGEQLIGVFKAQGALTDAARVLVNIGILHYRRDAYLEALTCYAEARQIFTTHGEALSRARVQVNEANVLAALHRTEEAVVAFEQAHACFQECDQPIFAAVVEINLGHLCYLLGQYTRALRLFESARAVFTQIEDLEGVAQCDLDSGDVYRALNLLPEALACYERASQRFTAMEAPYDAGRAELGRAAVLVALGRLEEAELALAQARAIFITLDNPLRLAQTQLLASTLSLARGQGGAAYSDAQKAARVFRRFGLEGLVAEAQFAPALAALEAGTTTARSMLRLRRTAERTQRGWLESRAARALGRYYLGRGQVSKGLRHLRQSVAILEAARTQVVPEDHHTMFLRDKMDAYEDLVLALTGRARPADLAEALQVVEQAKSRLLLERLQAVLPADPTNAPLGSLRARLSAHYHQLLEEQAPSETRKPGRLGEARAGLLELERRYQEALQGLQPSSPLRPPRSLGLGELQQALPKTETLVEFYTTQNHIGAFVVTTTGIHYTRLSITVEEIERELRRFRFQLQKAAAGGAYFTRYEKELVAEVQQVLSRLYQMLWEPLEPLMKTEAVVVIPHGLLHSLPFHLLYSGGRYLLDRHCLTYALSAGLWYAVNSKGAPSAPQGEALFMGASETLPHTSRELTLLQSIFPHAVSLLGTEATLEAFRLHAPTANCIHLATHGIFRADNPLFSSLQFADGWLMASDLYQLRLSATLVTLSACRTAAAQVQAGDEVFGLLRGFFAAGARTIVASLWPVDDRATAELMTLFYQSLGEKGKSAGLQVAQRQLRELYPHPYFWGAFLAMGSRN